MSKHVNVLVPLACPHCAAELYATLDDLQEMASVRCSRCGTEIELRPEEFPHAGVPSPSPEETFNWPAF